MTQPPLSRQIQRLEDEMGAELFDRASRPLALTEAGPLLFEHSVQVLDRMDELQAMMRRHRDLKRTRLAIGFVGSTLYGYLPELIRTYRAAKPKVEISLVELTTMEQVAALKEGRIDIGFGRVPFEDPAIERTLMRNERLCLALPRTHHLASRAGALRLEEVASEGLIVYPRAPRPSYADTVLALFSERKLRPPVIHEVRDVQSALGLVAAEVGVSLVPVSLASPQRDNVVFRHLEDTDAVSPIYFSKRKGDRSPEGAFLLKLIYDIYRQKGVDRGLRER